MMERELFRCVPNSAITMVASGKYRNGVKDPRASLLWRAQPARSGTRLPNYRVYRDTNQAETAAVFTPRVVTNSASSPVSYISRTMSQAPTNSSLT
jgi:hypothetical protein